MRLNSSIALSFPVRMMDLFKDIVSGPIFDQLLVYVVFLALNMLQFEEVSHWTVWPLCVCFDFNIKSIFFEEFPTFIIGHGIECERFDQPNCIQLHYVQLFIEYFAKSKHRRRYCISRTLVWIPGCSTKAIPIGHKACTETDLFEWIQHHLMLDGNIFSGRVQHEISIFRIRLFR